MYFLLLTKGLTAQAIVTAQVDRCIEPTRQHESVHLGVGLCYRLWPGHLAYIVWPIVPEANNRAAVRLHIARSQYP